MSDISKPAYKKFVQRLETKRRMGEYDKPKEEVKEGYMGLLAKRATKDVESTEDEYDMNAVLEEYFEIVTKLAEGDDDGE